MPKRAKNDHDFHQGGRMLKGMDMVFVELLTEPILPRKLKTYCTTSRSSFFAIASFITIRDLPTYRLLIPSIL